MCFWNCELICWKKNPAFKTQLLNNENQQKQPTVFIYMFTFSHPETHRGPKVRKSKRRRSIKRQPWSRLKHLERTWGYSISNQRIGSEPASGTSRNHSVQEIQEIYQIEIQIPTKNHNIITKIVCVYSIEMYIKYEIFTSRSTSSFHGFFHPRFAPHWGTL